MCSQIIKLNSKEEADVWVHSEVNATIKGLEKIRRDSYKAQRMPKKQGVTHNTTPVVAFTVCMRTTLSLAKVAGNRGQLFAPCLVLSA